MFLSKGMTDYRVTGILYVYSALELGIYNMYNKNRL